MKAILRSGFLALAFLLEQTVMAHGSGRFSEQNLKGLSDNSTNSPRAISQRLARR